MKRILDWIAGEDAVGAYGRSVAERSRAVVARYGRRNVAFQGGAIMGPAKRDALIAAGDAAVARLRSKLVDRIDA